MKTLISIGMYGFGPHEVQYGWFSNSPDIDLVLTPSICSNDEICEYASRADIILTSPANFISREALESGKKTMFVQFASAGYDAIDVEATVELGIPVTNNPDFPSIPVAEHTVMSILVLMKYAGYSSLELSKGNWGVQTELIPKIRELHGKTVGILG
jgi:lactate dehydrogenase-like 2-hydroxyacid dehydrogenase